MKPTFALDLTRDTIGLLHRTPKGWLSVGEVAFDAPDMAEALDYLRKTALGLSPMGVATKIILPNSQVLYAEVHAPGPSRDEKRKQIAAALEGQTPYDVADLVFDWSGKGARVKVAIVARETLAEAEGFAVEHRLNPVSFVAIPEAGTFVGEPWFGPTEAAASLLAEDETVERDRDAVVVLHRELPKAEPVVAGPEPEPQTGPELQPELELTVEAPVTQGQNEEQHVEDEEPLPGLEEALNAELPEEAPPISDPLPVSEPLAPEIDDTVEEAIDEHPSFETSIAEKPIPGPEEAELAPPPVADAVVRPAVPEVEEAPLAHVTDTAAFPDLDDETPSTAEKRKLAVGDVDEDLPPAPSSAALVAFASRRNAPAAAVARPMDGVTRPSMASGAAAARPTAPVTRPGAAKGFVGLVTAPSIPGTRAKPKAKIVDIPRPTGAGPTTVKSPTRPGGTFGAVAPPKSRTGMIFMILVALLLIFLALVGAWSSLYLGGDTPSTTEGASATDVLPDVSDEMLADMQDPEGMTEPLPEGDVAALSEADAGDLATEGLPVNIAGEVPEPATETTTETETELEIAVAEPEPVAPAPEPAPDTVVATDVAVAQPPVEDQDEIFLSAMDAPPPALDALALPALTETRDLLPDPPMPPPAPGTVYQFEANGLLKPTPEGIVSPEGVMLIAGKPQILPPSRSEAATAAALAAAAIAPPAVDALDTAEDRPASSADASLVTAGPEAAIPDAAIPDAAVPDATADTPLPPADPAMAGFRPRPRPKTVSPVPGDDAALAGDAETAFAGLRPLPRPASVVAAASASRPSDTVVTDLGAQGASLTAQAEAQLAAAAALEAQNPSIVAISMRPAARPKDLSSAVEAAVAAAVREPAPEVEVAAAAPEANSNNVDEIDEPETVSAAPSIPTRASVAKQATYKNAINLSKINLIGTYGTASGRYALVRKTNGRYTRVEVGDKIDGGTVKAITETEVRYQKGGKLVSLKMPKV
jgi:hypothetical protein